MEINDVLEVLGMKLPEAVKDPKDLSKDDFKILFQGEYIGRKVAHDDESIRSAAIGKFKGTLANEVKNIFKEIGVKFDGKDIEENDRLILDKVIEVGKKEAANIMKSLKEEGTKDYDKKLQDLNKKLETVQTDYQTLLQDHTGLKDTLTTKEKEFEGFKTDIVKKTKVDHAWQNLTFGEEVNDFTKKGFQSAISEKYLIELSDEKDSEDGLRIIDRKTNSRVIDNNKYPTLESLLKKEAAEAKLLKMSTNGQKQQNSFKFENNGKEVKISEMAQKIADGTL
jgi:hypothetical protein